LDRPMTKPNGQTYVLYYKIVLFKKIELRETAVQSALDMSWCRDG
jgi:hypothetical protein